ncbi:serine/threonine-protein kinase [Actinomadura madurae]|uniref:serine/threonine-protein kinase n=1 Tax=Actinomadura madurae TaxID=1993 RepID=UPI0020D20F2D|nr:serine/threonine-protein kinase [Actinomadura madurae]
MVSPDGRLKITDFGIARRLAAASQTQTGMVMGTAHYISPEQAQGLKLSPAADLYSLGVVAYECLTGAPPFDGPTPVEVALKHVRDAPAELPARVPEEARELVMEMLAKEPRDRPADAHTVAARALAIRAGLSTGRISAVPAGGAPSGTVRCGPSGPWAALRGPAARTSLPNRRLCRDLTTRQGRITSPTGQCRGNGARCWRTCPSRPPCWSASS